MIICCDKCYNIMLRYDMIICCAIIKPDCIFTNNFFQKGSKNLTWSILLGAITLETMIGGGASEELSLHVQLYVLYSSNLYKQFLWLPISPHSQKTIVFSHYVECTSSTSTFSKNVISIRVLACIAWCLPYCTLINLFPTKVVYHLPL